LSSLTGALGSLPKPYSVLDMVQAVNYLLGHLSGDATLVPPAGLEVFDQEPTAYRYGLIFGKTGPFEDAAARPTATSSLTIAL
jgi:hypothetical protein